MGNKFNRNFKRIESQRFRIVVLVIGCFLVSMTFVVVSKPQSLAFANLSSKKRSEAPPGSLRAKDFVASQNLDVKKEVETEQSKPRCDDMDSNSELCKKGGVIKRQEKSSASPFDSGEGEAQRAQQLESNHGSEPSRPNSEADPATKSNYPTVDVVQGNRSTALQQENRTERQEIETSTEQDTHPHGDGVQPQGDEVHHRITLPTISNYTINDSIQDENSSVPLQAGSTSEPQEERTTEEGSSSTPTMDKPAQEERKTDPEQSEDQLQTQERSTICDPTSGQCMDGDKSLPIVSDSTVVDQTPKENTAEPRQSGPGFMKLERKPLCNVSHPRVDLCNADGDLRVHQTPSSPIYVESYEPGDSARDESWQIQPYARKGDSVAFSRVRQVVVKSSKEVPRCAVNHSAPALIFSTGGYVGNLFHDFTDILLPLFLTAHPFNREIQLIITDKHDWWIGKFLLVLQKISAYPAIDIDKDERVHCFSKVLVGLRCHRELSVEPSFGYTLADFTQFMRSSYSLKRDAVTRIGEHPGRKPRLLIVARKRTRTFTNVHEIVQMAQELGYEVVVDEADVGSKIAHFAEVVNSCDVMMGVHGAGLTNMVFLPVNATLIQIVPWGGLEGIAMLDFGHAATHMKLNYLQYSISPEESSLIEHYPRDHTVFREPYSYHNRGWDILRTTFMDQNVKLNVVRYRAVLLKAIDHLQP